MSPGWRKSLISAAIAAHVFAIGLQNLPAHKSLWAIHKFYIGLSGQFQGWIMFANVATESNRLELVARAPGGATSEPYGPSRSWSVPFLDVMMDAIRSDETAGPVLTALRARAEAGARPSELRIKVLKKALSEPGAAFVVDRELSRQW